MQYKILKIILISSFSIYLGSIESKELECNADFELIAEKKICVKNLEKNKEKKIGLMNISKLPKNHQVNFIWNDKARIRCMWMKNTSIPLDILFVNKNNIILEKGEPFSKKKICQPASMVIEANRGELLAEYKKINPYLDYEK